MFPGGSPEVPSILATSPSRAVRLVRVLWICFFTIKKVGNLVPRIFQSVTDFTDPEKIDTDRLDIIDNLLEEIVNVGSKRLNLIYDLLQNIDEINYHLENIKDLVSIVKDLETDTLIEEIQYYRDKYQDGGS